LEDYDTFVEKFKPKKTTDDCYTPPPVYDAVLGYVRKKYGVTSEIARPFWPGGDYETYDYPPECVVVDNPPFSILAKILRNYMQNGIKFFLFAPHLTLFNYAPICPCILTCSDIAYENGAKVKTSFVTNLEDPEVFCACAKELASAIKIAQKTGKTNPGTGKLDFPRNVTNAARFCDGFCERVDFTLKRGECVFLGSFGGRGIFGGGAILCDSAAEQLEAKKLEAKRLKRLKMEMSATERTPIKLRPTAREREMIRALNARNLEDGG
jgi:hypothetical protein